MRSKLFAVLSFLVAASMLLAACQTATPTPEKIIETVKVVETVIVEKQGTPVVITTTPSPTKPAEPTATKVPEAAKPAMLRINLGSYPDIIDPQKSSFVNEISHLKLIYEGLTRLNDKLETVPAAAEKWEYNKDATELTFTLRKGLKYTDGTILNAKRFEYSILRNIDRSLAI